MNKQNISPETVTELANLTTEQMAAYLLDQFGLKPCVEGMLVQAGDEPYHNEALGIISLSDIRAERGEGDCLARTEAEYCGFSTDCDSEPTSGWGNSTLPQDRMVWDDTNLADQVNP